jgi:alpha-L-rhamnosidase
MRSRMAGISAALVVMLAMPVLGTAPVLADPVTVAGARGLRAGSLTVEHQADPLGVDVAKPRLGWVLDSDRPAARQSAYQVQVSSAPGRAGDVWDSGRVPSAKSFDVEYAGAGLRPRTRYYWRVRVWDGDRRASAWSAAAWFETAFLDGADFHGDWIGARADRPTTSLQGASWIWYPQGNPADSAPVGTRYFRRTFDLPDAQVTAAHFQLTADDSFVLHVNGKQVAHSPQVADSWRTAVDADLTADLRPGRNVIAIQAANAQPGPSGLVGRLHIETADANPIDIVTDAAWQSSDVDTPGWQQPDFDDSTWPASLVAAAYGSGPWGNSVTAAPPPEPLLRKDFTTKKRIRSARVHGLRQDGPLRDVRRDPGTAVRRQHDRREPGARLLRDDEPRRVAELAVAR